MSQYQFVYSLETGDSNNLGRAGPRSRDSCLTCRIRAKKCSYATNAVNQNPQSTANVCDECQKHNIECMLPPWPAWTKGANGTETKELKDRIRQDFVQFRSRSAAYYSITQRFGSGA